MSNGARCFPTFHLALRLTLRGGPAAMLGSAFHRDPAFPVDGASLLSVGAIWCRRALKPAGSMAFRQHFLECHVSPRRVNVLMKRVNALPTRAG